LLARSANASTSSRGRELFTSGDGGRRLRHLGEIGGQPAALLTQAASDLDVALHDGTIKRSTDGGSTWVVRSDAVAGV
jgi:hypothetical protein